MASAQLPNSGDVIVSGLPRRVAHATHALLAASRDLHGPPVAAEVCLYDPEALSVRATGAALREAAKKGLAMCASGVWAGTLLAYELGPALEDRFLRETEVTAFSTTSEAPSHGMIPGSHERAYGPECRCGRSWPCPDAAAPSTQQATEGDR